MADQLTNTADATATNAASTADSAPSNGADTTTLAVTAPAAAAEGTPATRDHDAEVEADLAKARETAESMDDALDRAAKAALAGKGVDEVEEAYQSEPDDEPVVAKPKEPAAGVPTPKPGDLSADDAKMLSRWALDAQDLPANPERRTKFLEGLRQRTEFTDRLASGQTAPQEGDAAKQGDNAPQQAASTQQAALDAAIAKHGKPITEFFGDEVGGPIAKALVSIAQELFGPAQQAANTFYASLEARDTEDGLSAAKANLKGVAIDSANVTKKAWELILAKRAAEGQAYNPMQYNLRHAIPEAANLLYQQDAKKHAAAELARRGTQALRGSPARGTRTPTGTPGMTEDQRLTAAAEAALANKGAAGAQAAYEGRK